MEAMRVYRDTGGEGETAPVAVALIGTPGMGDSAFVRALALRVASAAQPLGDPAGSTAHRAPVSDLEECYRAGLDDEQARRVVHVSRQTGLEVFELLMLIERFRPAPTPSLSDLNPNDYFPPVPEPVNRQEARARSMRKPTGNPSDARRRGR